MFTVLISIIIVLAILLILVILGQNSKGGVGAAFGGSASQIMGVTKTGNILEKATWVLAIAILVLSLGSSAFHQTSAPSGFSSPNVENAQRQMLTPSFDDESLLPTEGEDADGLDLNADPDSIE
ncbi:preprotein translocase subunit SecG [Cyclobacterium jeungdonense]|uniref:Protein-export membrane protein SecG n=1 Tax=Cyclobacterium jeungdonense TaxID=708087 RepID=A0ABT8C9V2_9BACT|nr:preprotein translocase subunit SecG [Cyclobacterium jeungdonense]MDN3688408.1 preprotein translocase subunit SecG [Cyclobacterium jeungdonense]